MMIDDRAAYEALAARDARFDGVFFVGVTTTGVYCRPICPARTPRQGNCRFFASAEAAEKAAFRPCLRCRPELAPGCAPVDGARRIAHLLTQRIEEGLIEQDAGLEEIAAQFAMSSRQLRRIVQRELGVSPIELMQTRRLLLAKQLLTETRLSVTEIGFASGFSSLRRFNDAFSSRYRMPPSRLRRMAANGRDAVAAGDSRLMLNYRPPYDWEGILEFLKTRAMEEVEFVTGESYARTIRLGNQTGWIRVTHSPARRALVVEFAHSLTPALPALLTRLRHLFDLTARPDQIAAHLAKDVRLAASARANPGLRVPGAFDGFEAAVRAVLGQQISVKAATRIACRFARAFGEEFATPFPELTRLSPTAERVAGAPAGEVARLGMIRSRASTLVALARAFTSGLLRIEHGNHSEDSLNQLLEIPGIAHWTVQYLAMRAMHWPDAFPKEDIVVRNALGGVTARRAEEMSQAWRPWRSYAVMHIWRNSAGLRKGAPGLASKYRLAAAG